MTTETLQRFDRLEDALANAETCGELSLQGVAAIPPEVGALRRLRRLEVHVRAGTPPQPLPEAVCELTELRELRVFRGVSEVPPAIAALVNLQKLSLYLGSITDLPAELGALANLEELDLAGNQLRTVPEAVLRLGKLRLLQLAENPLRQIPDGMGELSRLEFFQCGPAPELRALPASIGKLRNLELLSVAGTSITALPDEICKMPKLGRCQVPRNKLTSLPEDLGSAPNLYLLTADQNALTTLPASLVDCRHLRQITLTGNTFSPEGMAIVDAIAARKGRRRVLVRRPRALTSLDAPLADAVLSQIARLGGTVKTRATPPEPRFEASSFGEVRLPESMRQWLHDVSFPDGTELGGTVLKGWGKMKVQLPRHASLDEFQCAKSAPYYTVAWQDVSRAYFLVDLDDHDVTNPTVYRLDAEDYDDPKPLETGLTLEKFLAKLRVVKKSAAEAP